MFPKLISLPPVFSYLNYKRRFSRNLSICISSFACFLNIFRNHVVLAVYCFSSFICFFTIHEHCAGGAAAIAFQQIKRNSIRRVFRRDVIEYAAEKRRFLQWGRMVWFYVYYKTTYFHNYLYFFDKKTLHISMQCLNQKIWFH